LFLLVYFDIVKLFLFVINKILHLFLKCRRWITNVIHCFSEQFSLKFASMSIFISIIWVIVAIIAVVGTWIFRSTQRLISSLSYIIVVIILLFCFSSNFFVWVTNKSYWLGFLLPEKIHCYKHCTLCLRKPGHKVKKCINKCQTRHSTKESRITFRIII
jgi:chromate transport protein ChrA